MFKSTRLVSALILAVCLSTSVFAQTPSPPFLQIEKAIQEKESKWKLASRRIAGNGKYALYHWKLKKSSVIALLFVHDTPEKAANNYRNFDLEAFGLKRTVLEGSHLDLGDENYIWKESGDGKTFGVDFRKGKVFVHIHSPEIENAEQFASVIAEALPAT